MPNTRSRKSRLHGFALATGLALLGLASTASAGPPSGVGAFGLRAPADTLIAGAVASGYHLEFRRESTLSFVPKDSTLAEVAVELADGRSVLLRFTYPLGVTMEDASAVENSLRAKWGEPSAASEAGGYRHVEWQQAWSRAVLDVPLALGLTQAMTLKLYDLDALKAAPDTTQEPAPKPAPAKKAKKPRHRKPAGSP